MKCPKCDGRGWYENPRYPNPASWSYAGEPTKKCGKCKETGYIIGNVKDVVDTLRHFEVYFAKNPEYLAYTKQCIAAIIDSPA